MKCVEALTKDLDKDCPTPIPTFEAPLDLMMLQNLDDHKLLFSVIEKVKWMDARKDQFMQNPPVLMYKLYWVETVYFIWQIVIPTSCFPLLCHIYFHQ